MNNLSIRIELPSFKSEDKKDRFVVMKTQQELFSLLKRYNDSISINTVGNGVIQIKNKEVKETKEDIIFLKEIHDKIAKHSFRFSVVVPSIESKDNSFQDISLLDGYTFA